MLSRRDFLRNSLGTLSLFAIPSFNLLARLASADEDDFVIRAIPQSRTFLPGVSLAIGSNFNGDWSDYERYEEMLLAYRHNAGALLVETRTLNEIESTLSALSSFPAFQIALKLSAKNGKDAVDTILERLVKLKRKTTSFLAVDLDGTTTQVEETLSNLSPLHEKGLIKHLGLSASPVDFEVLPALWERHPIDYIQIEYSPLHREAERSLLGAAQNSGIAVFATNPYSNNTLLIAGENDRYPGPIASRFGADTRKQAVLKFILSHPAITSVIAPAENAAEVQEIMHASYLPLPNQDERELLARELII